MLVFRVANKLNWKYGTPFPYPDLPLPTLPSLALELVPLNPARGLGSDVSSPAGSGAESSQSRIWSILSLDMTSGGNNFNDFPENQLTKFQLGGKNVTILHTFAALFQCHLCTAENGTFGVPRRPRPGRGTMRPRYETSREIRDGWQPYWC